MMACVSLFLFFLYRDTFGLDPGIAFSASVLPNILPSLKGIPVGLNTSYAMWGLLPLVISLLLLTKALKGRGAFSWFAAGSALAFYYLGLNLPGQPSVNFLIPSVLFFLLMFFPLNRLKTILLFLPFSGLGAWQIYKQFLYSHKEPTEIPMREILSRIRQFIEMSDILAFNTSISFYLALGLVVLGIAGLVSANTFLFRKPEHFYFRTKFYSLLLTAWVLCWMGANSLAYIAFSPTFRPYDYAYTFNFGSVLLQMTGLFFLAVLFLRFFNLSKHQNSIFGILIILIISLNGIQRIHYRYDQWGWKVQAEERSKLIRDTLLKKPVPKGAQIIFLGMQTAHTGTYTVNSGELRYLLGRNDVSGLIGPDIYPNDVFSGVDGWTADMMSGFNEEHPVIIFRYDNGIIEPVNLLLQVVSSGTRELPRLKWRLFDLKKGTGKPVQEAHGAGMDSYNKYITENLPPDLKSTDIAFAPKNPPDTFIDEIAANQLASIKGLLKSEISFENTFTIRNVLLKHSEGKPYLQILLRVDKMPSETFRLGYGIDDEEEYISIWDFVLAGDHILINTPCISEIELQEGIRLGLVNGTGWPHKPLEISNRNEKQNNSIFIKWSQNKEEGEY